MVSHKTLGGLEISIGGGGLRFKRRPGAHAICVGKQLKGTAGPTNGGRYDKAFQAKFTAATRSCGVGKVSHKK
jgi:hypothetical protein